MKSPFDSVFKDMEDKSYWVYMVECADGSLYTGFSTDVRRRVATHNQGKGAKYTRTRLPVRLVYTERFFTLSEALSREHAIKKLTRKQKLALCQNSGRNR